jgi:outer membrane protein OmpA-like peptidoglycan-associated protein
MAVPQGDVPGDRAEDGMKRIGGLALAAVTVLSSACASSPDPTMCAQVGILLGLGGGVAGGAAIRDNTKNDAHETAGMIGMGLAGAALGGAGAYFLCKALAEEEAPPPPAPAPKAAPAPAPAPTVDRCAEVIRLRGVNFDFDSDEVRPDAAVILDEAATLLADALRECPTRSVSVEGHTDATGDAAYNQSLSERRANAVLGYLADKGVDASRLSAKGFGESSPIAPNETREGRALNRRVELRLVQ